MSSIPNRPHMNPYDYHKYLINQYVLIKPGDTSNLNSIVGGSKNFKTDRDVVYENMRFIWNEEDVPSSWEENLARKYYDKLFREYCICDLSRFKENRIANRFRIEKEIVSGKGQFICSEKSCQEIVGLRTWEVNFAYVEKGERKNALVKIRLCPECSEKLNYHSKKREVKRLKKKSKDRKLPSKSTDEIVEASQSQRSPPSPQCSESESIPQISSPGEPIRSYPPQPVEDENLWKKSSEPEIRGRDEEFDDYLADLLL